MLNNCNYLIKIIKLLNLIFNNKALTFLSETLQILLI